MIGGERGEKGRKKKRKREKKKRKREKEGEREWSICVYDSESVEKLRN